MGRNFWPPVHMGYRKTLERGGAQRPSSRPESRGNPQAAEGTLWLQTAGEATHPLDFKAAVGNTESGTGVWQGLEVTLSY